MEQKTFRAENMLAALDLVKKELGSEALILSVRKVLNGPAWQVWQKPQVEVVAVSTAQDPGTPDPAAQKQNAEQVRKKKQQKVEAVSKTAPAVDEAPKMEADPVPVTKPANDIYLDALFSAGKNKASLDRMEGTPAEENKSEFLEKLILQLAKTQIDRKEERKSAEEAIEKEPAHTEKSIQQDFPRLDGVLSHLADLGLGDDLIHQLGEDCRLALPVTALSEDKKILDFIHSQLVSRIRVEGKFEKIGIPIFLVGPSGAGKTTTCAKLAVHYSNDMNKKVLWVCADTVRFGAVLQARNFCETIGIPMQPVYSPGELKELIANVRGEFDVILVDMPAFNPLDETSLLELGGMLTAVPARMVWVVAPVILSGDAMQKMVNTVKPFHPTGLVLTKLDETTRFGDCVNLACRCQLPITFFGFGSQIINELAPARSEQLVQALFAERFIQ